MKRPLKIIDSTLTACLLIALSVSLLIIALRNAGCIEFLELSAYDLYIRSYSRPDGPDPHIILVTISEATVKFHVRNLRDKLEVRRRTQIVHTATRQGIV